jgi:DNA processing protein
VLPQGIMTFGSGFKNYYKQIIDGDILVLSTFQAKAPWRPELAMARNPIIYGLADEIFVAESSDKGGTWSGVLDGLKKNRKIFVRQPDPNETNANHLLIQKGAVAVDFHGYPVQDFKPKESFQKPILVNEPDNTYKNQLLELLKKNQYTIKEIIIKLNLSITETDLKNFLANQKDIEIINKRPIRYTYKNSNNQQKSLFD